MTAPIQSAPTRLTQRPPRACAFLTFEARLALLALALVPDRAAELLGLLAEPSRGSALQALEEWRSAPRSARHAALAQWGRVCARPSRRLPLPAGPLRAAVDGALGTSSIRDASPPLCRRLARRLVRERG